jgi:hypothetical protein
MVQRLLVCVLGDEVVRELTWGRASRAKVWHNEPLPEGIPAVQAMSQLKTIMRPKTSALPGRAASCAIELVAAKSPRLYYGLLGARYDPSLSGGLNVIVPVTAPRSYDNLAAMQQDIHEWGLLDEFAQSVIDEVQKLPETMGLGPGELTFNSAKYAVAGSAPAVFRALSRSIIRLLVADVDRLSDEELISMIDPWNVTQ